MGRKPSTNLNLPKGMRARKRTRKNGTVVIYYFYDSRDTSGKRKEIPLGTDYVIAVQEWTRLEAEKIPKGQEATFATAAERYWHDIALKRVKNTQDSIKRSLKLLRAFFGDDAPLAAIEPQHIRQYLNWRQSAPQAAKIEVGYFSAMFNHARECGYTDRENPVRGVKRGSASKRKVYIEDYLYAAVYRAANSQIRDLMDIAYLTGQRPIDIVGLHSSHIYNGVLHISQQKTDKKLRFELSGKLAEIIERRLPENGGWLFLNKRGKKLTRARLGDWFKQLRDILAEQSPELAGELENFQFRDLRAKSATDIYLSADHTAAKEQLGHSSERMTETYIRKAKILKPLEQVCGTPPDFAEK